MYIMGFQKKKIREKMQSSVSMIINRVFFSFLLLSASDYRLKQMKVEILIEFFDGKFFFK